MHDRSSKKVEFQGEQLEIGGLSMQVVLQLRARFKTVQEGDMDAAVAVMADVMATSIKTPKMTVAELMALDVETFNALFDVVTENNGMSAPGNVSRPKQSGT